MLRKELLEQFWDSLIIHGYARNVDANEKENFLYDFLDIKIDKIKQEIKRRKFSEKCDYVLNKMCGKPQSGFTDCPFAANAKYNDCQLYVPEQNNSFDD